MKVSEKKEERNSNMCQTSGEKGRREEVKLEREGMKQ